MRSKRRSGPTSRAKAEPASGVRDEPGVRAAARADGGDRGPTRLQDVAAAAGVSVMTVSNVVNRRFHLMRPATRAQVERAIRQLEYRPNAIARGLRKAQSLTVGFLIVDDTQSFLSNPFITEMTAGISSILGKRGYGLLLHAVPEAAIEKTIFFKNVRADGLCLFLSGEDARRRAIIERVAQLNGPMVLLQEVDMAPGLDACIVRQRDFEGGVALARHALERGARRFAILVPRVSWPAATQRLGGMLHGLKAEAIPPPEIVTCGDTRDADVSAALVSHFQRHRPPDAILALNDQMAVTAIQVLAARGLGTPGDVLVSGFNGFEPWSVFEPRLTTAISRAYDMGVAAARAMLKRLEQGTFARRELVLDVSLRVGASTTRT